MVVILIKQNFQVCIEKNDKVLDKQEEDYFTLESIVDFKIDYDKEVDIDEEEDIVGINYYSVEDKSKSKESKVKVNVVVENIEVMVDFQKD